MSEQTIYGQFGEKGTKEGDYETIYNIIRFAQEPQAIEVAPQMEDVCVTERKHYIIDEPEILSSQRRETHRRKGEKQDYQNECDRYFELVAQRKFFENSDDVI